MSQVKDLKPIKEILKWPRADVTRVPLNIFSNPDIYKWEQDLIFRGPTWSFLCLESEITNAGDFITTKIGETSIIVIRTFEDSINALVNKCVHKGSIICYEPCGNRKNSTIVCPYHNWVYEFDGKLKAVAFE